MCGQHLKGTICGFYKHLLSETEYSNFKVSENKKWHVSFSLESELYTYMGEGGIFTEAAILLPLNIFKL